MPGVDWAYGNLMDSRDINSHDMGMANPAGGRFGGFGGGGKNWTCDKLVKVLCRTDHLATTPTGLISAGRANRHTKPESFQNIRLNLLPGIMHYWTYYKESVGFCDWGYAKLFDSEPSQGIWPYFRSRTDDISMRSPGRITPSGWTRNGTSRLESKKGNFCHSGQEQENGEISRDTITGPGHPIADFHTEKPIYDGKKWEWQNCRELYFTEDGVEKWKDHFYDIEGWDKETGYHKRKTLEDLGLKHVADVLKSKNRLV